MTRAFWRVGERFSELGVNQKIQLRTLLWNYQNSSNTNLIPMSVLPTVSFVWSRGHH